MGGRSERPLGFMQGRCSGSSSNSSNPSRLKFSSCRRRVARSSRTLLGDFILPRCFPVPILSSRQTKNSLQTVFPGTLLSNRRPGSAKKPVSTLVSEKRSRVSVPSCVPSRDSNGLWYEPISVPQLVTDARHSEVISLVLLCPRGYTHSYTSWYRDGTQHLPFPFVALGFSWFITADNREREQHLPQATGKKKHVVGKDRALRTQKQSLIPVLARQAHKRWGRSGCVASLLSSRRGLKAVGSMCCILWVPFRERVLRCLDCGSDRSAPP